MMTLEYTTEFKSFKQWLFQDVENSFLLKTSTMIISLSFIGFKIFYPYPNFMPPDSDSYIEAAFNNDFINMWAIGYSKFLRLISSFTNSHFILVLLQYVLLQVSLHYFLFTLKYLLLIKKWTFRLLFILNIINPLIFHISNFVSSDSLFLTLSLIWLTQILWIYVNPSRNLLLMHATIVLFAFMVRHNALYYPIFSIIALITIKSSFKIKFLGIATITIAISSFIACTLFHYYKETGKIQYSAFGGWQIASNALYGYAHSEIEPITSVPIKYRNLHAIVNHHMDSIKRLTLRPDTETSIYYQWDENSPLKLFLNKTKNSDTSKNYFKKWASVAPLYASYGNFLIAKHPINYIKHFIWPNLVRYYSPPFQFMGYYNIGEKTVDPVVSNWFGWKDNKVKTLLNNKIIITPRHFTLIMSIIIPMFLLSFIYYISSAPPSEKNKISHKIIWTIFFTWLTNFIFSVVSAPIELRYQIFSLIITFTFSIILVAYLLNGLLSRKKVNDSLIESRKTN